VAFWESIADLPLEIESCALEGLELQMSKEFTRACTVVRLAGRGAVGAGEDVTYDGLDHVALQLGGAPDLAGSWTLDSFCRHLDDVQLWPAPPVREDSRNYRRWAFESAALDLALRQGDLSLAAALGRAAAPVTFVVSMRLAPLGEAGAPMAERLQLMLERDPALRFKLDPTAEWTEALFEELAATGAVESVDLKGAYTGTPVDNPPTAELYRRVVDFFPDAWIEDPALTEETRPVIEPHRERVTWDAVLHSAADIDALPWPPRTINVKPSRFGTLRELSAVYELCERRGIGCYGGGQSELSVGRGHIQYLASLFHPTAANDVAPSGYNDPANPAGLPRTPLEPTPAPSGFAWAS